MKTGLLDPFPLWTILPLTVGLALLSVELGYRLAGHATSQPTIDDRLEEVYELATKRHKRHKKKTRCSFRFVPFVPFCGGFKECLIAGSHWTGSSQSHPEGVRWLPEYDEGH